MLDFLSDILINFSVKGTLYFRTSFTPPWGVAVPAFQNVVRFHFAHRGNCMVQVEGEEKPVSIAQGDLIIIPHGKPHNLYCGQDPEQTVLPLDTVLEKSGYTGSGVLVYGGTDDDHETQLICGHFSLDTHSHHILLDRLPPFIHLKNYGEASGKWMESTLRVIGNEAGVQRLGGDLIALKMSEAIFAQAIRGFVESDEAAKWHLSGFSNKNLRMALDEFHKSPAEDWSVQNLAQSAGMSRTSFATLFQKELEMTPMQYVTSWRMEIAKKTLTTYRSSLTDAAESAGYASDSAFVRVFKKEVGMTPVQFQKENS